jgi:hypothetical protein
LTEIVVSVGENGQQTATFGKRSVFGLRMDGGFGALCGFRMDTGFEALCGFRMDSGFEAPADDKDDMLWDWWCRWMVRCARVDS